MNRIDRSFNELINELGSLSEKELYHRIRSAFEKVPAETRRSCQDFFNRFGFWGRLEPENGVYEHSIDSCELKKAALKASKKRILLADRTKFGHTTTYRTCSLSAFDAIYTNADDRTVAPLREKGLTVFNSTR